MMDFKTHSNNFFSKIREGHIEIYNEFSLQHEFGIFLRQNIDSNFKVQFERPSRFFELSRNNFIKKEIDVAIFNTNYSEKYAIELKYPRNGQHPEQIFKACQDISFLEQLHQHGFTKCYFIIVVEDPLFYSHGAQTGIYKFFRAGMPIHGFISKPTGAKDDSVEIIGSYYIIWKDIDKDRKFAVIEIE